MTDSLRDEQGAFAPAENTVSETSLKTAAALSEGAEDTGVQAEPNGFVELGLAPELVQAVADLGYSQPTAVQAQAIPLAMGREGARYTDLMVSSQTGSGKTAAFLLPVLHTLVRQQAEAEAAERQAYERAAAVAAERGEPPPKRPRRKNPTDARHFKAATPGALVLCPTRELAQQVAHDAIDLVKHCRGLRVTNVVGGMPYQLQIARLQNANLVVATPGRLLDLQRSQQIKLDQMRFLVVDEADRMLDLGFADDLAEINQLTIERHQTMMFSATFAPRIQQLAARVMREPQRLEIASPQQKHANIEQKLFWADNAQHKRKMLDHWLRDTGINQAIVFASTQVECDGLATDLQQEGFSAVALHGALSQGLRNRRLMALRSGQVQILVATDVAARGIDVPTITHVFNFGLPMKAEDYTHRIGRTGRAGRDGLAVTFAEFRDRRKIFDIEGYSRQQFRAEIIPGLEPQQRFPDTRTRADYGSRGDGGPRGGRFGGNGGGRGGDRGGFGSDRRSFGDRGNGGGFGDRRDNDAYSRKSGFGDRGGNSFAPRNDAAGGGRGRGAPAGGGFGGKPFVPHDARRPARPAR
ncbi:DEAD/DEAH box helicase [Xylophilus sp.]|uniref:DEAD/DEAH box helicase n=1 Tax=Xylophilus sp. TaxID=2653893 RepID=UPI002D7F6E37|nr:DEAD/DEAH box helicase [Xylophilus sp.]